MAQIGSRGERLDLLVRQGTTLGPFIVTLTNPNGTPVNLTGCVITGQVRKNALDIGNPVANFLIVYVDRLAGQYSFEIPASETALIDAGEYQKDEKSRYEWDMQLKDSIDRVLPLYYGTFENYRGVTHA